MTAVEGYRAIPKAAAFQRGSSEASSRSRRRRRSRPAPVSPQNHRAISFPARGRLHRQVALEVEGVAS
ncbi:MAG: hypothetical protein DMD96_13845 [Candidatus Rokuibacteriota bacterium]|nr:MAG: hypothetical protein DMD96_13845 [Candidatus Rokubacteria bacterium]